MSVRNEMQEYLDGYLDFAGVKTTSIADANSSVVMTVEGDVGPVEEAEELDAESFEHAAILHRPVAPTADGECETAVWRRGDELVVLASKDRRWQVSIDEGEVVVRAYGQDAPMLRLDPSGVAYVLAPEVRIEETKDGTVESIPLGDVLQRIVDALWAAFQWTPAATDGGAALKVAWTTALTTSVPPFNPAVSPTVASSKHKVEP